MRSRGFAVPAATANASLSAIAPARPQLEPKQSNSSSGWLVGSTQDPAEHSADAAANAVITGYAVGEVSRGSSTAIGNAPPAIDGVMRSPGRSLDPVSRAYFEPRFGRDLSHVRVHEGAEASAAAESIDAHAFTAGNHIGLAAGQGRPDDIEGRRLMAHELAHVVQSEGQTQPLVRRKPTAKAGKAAKKPARTFGGLKVSPNSQITAAQMVEMIKESPQLAQWMKDLFAASGNSIVLTFDPQKGFPLPPGVTDADVPEWLKNTLLAINEKQWNMTTGTSIVTEKSKWTRTKLVPDAKQSEIPARIPSKVGQDDIITGETIDTETLDSKQMAGEGLVVIANRFQGKAGVGTSVPRDRKTIVETFFHEFGAHAALDSQGKFDESSHGLTGNWKSAPLTEADKLAQSVWQFFALPDKLDEDAKNQADFLEMKRQFDQGKAEWEREKAIMDALRNQMKKKPLKK